MIKYDLVCEHGHEFDSWFNDSTTFDKLSDMKAINCPICNSSNIQKQIMSPSIKKNTSYDYVRKNFKYVGDKFANEAIKQYEEYGEVESMYGTVTEDEKEKLIDKDIPCLFFDVVKHDS